MSYCTINSTKEDFIDDFLELNDFISLDFISKETMKNIPSDRELILKRFELDDLDIEQDEECSSFTIEGKYYLAGRANDMFEADIHTSENCENPIDGIVIFTY